jgi:hypothetical protein
MFLITWVFDKLGYMPKIDMQVGKVQIDTQVPDFKMWPFPSTKEVRENRIQEMLEEDLPKKKSAVKKTVKKPVVKKTTTRKPKAK